jgi:putative glutamine amidotransferase
VSFSAGGAVVVAVDSPPSPPPQATSASTATIGDNRRHVATRPVIGITAYAVDASWGPWHLPAALVPLSYLRSVERAGGCAFVVLPRDDSPDGTLDRLDGLILTGGPDVDPALYGAEPHPETDAVDLERDRSEVALLAAALERDMPVLAVCRGSQILNVALGGDLEQHVPDLVGHEGHRDVVGSFSQHSVGLREGTRLRRLLGERTEVCSHHHQGYRRLGAGLREAGRADDGTIEALEDPSRRFAVGVLWHPEEGDDPRLFEELVTQARGYRAASA